MKFYLGIAAGLGVLLAVVKGYGPALLGLLLLVMFIWSRIGARTTSGAYRTVTVRGHSHGGRDGALIAKHEAGHVAAARYLGGRVNSAQVWDDGGLVQATLPTSDPAAAITFLRAGAIAAGTSRGAGADNDLIRRELRGVPARDRRAVERQATADARRAVSRASGQIRRDAATLRERGRL